MKIGLLGLGRMGRGLAEWLRRQRHEAVGYDRNALSRTRTTLQEAGVGGN
jgi:6-phosphogluconate dehydrogenase (decarboxylating)